MKICKLKEDQYSEYLSLAGEYGSIFNDLRWLTLFGDKVSVFSIMDNDNRLAGSFFLYSQQVSGLKYIKSPPFTPTNGLFYTGKTTNRSRKISDEKSLMSTLVDFLDSQRYGILRISFPSDIIDFQPFIWKKYKVVPNYTYVIDLLDPTDDIFSSFSAEKRNEIKKAGKDNILICQETDYGIIQGLVEKVFNRTGIKYDTKILTRILLEFSDQTNSFAYVAKAEKETVAFSFCLHDKKTAFYLFGGNSSGSNHSGAGSATLWECVRKAKSLDIKKFDFEGSMNPGIEHYFRGFGGILVPYFTVNKAIFPLEIVLKFVKREYF